MLSSLIRNKRINLLKNFNNKRKFSVFDIHNTFQSFTKDFYVEDIIKMKGNVHNLSSVAAVVDAAQAVKHMANSNVGSVAVCQSRHVIGIFTERDYMKKIGASDDVKSINTNVEDVMTTNVTVVTPDSSLFDCVAYMMGPISFRHLPVVTDLDDKYLVDIISVKDVLSSLISLIDTNDGYGQGEKYSRILNVVTTADLLSVHQREPQLVGVNKDVTVREALQNMSHQNVGSTAVMDGDEFVGIFTERDFLKKCMVMGRKSSETIVSEVMTPSPTVVKTTDNLDTCIRLFLKYGFRHLPVQEENSPVLGMISVQDIMRVIMYAE